MIALIQRVSTAAVRIDGAEIAAIGKGILALIGVERGDGEVEAQRLAERVLAYRIFADGQKAAEAAHVSTGRFGADMQVSLVNDGPVTFWLQVAPSGKS